MSAGLRAGYKQTEVGVIPKDWEVKRIGDIASVGSGGTPRREVPAYWGGSIPWVTTSQVDFGAISEAGQYITDEGLQNSPAKLLPPGTLLMALYGQGKTRGKVGVLAMQAATNQACASISLYQGVSREFVLHFLTSRYEQIRKSSNSGSQDNLNGNIVKGLLIATPSPTEQRAIAAALSDVDALLAGLDRLIAKKRDLKQAAMQQLLTGETRLPGFQGEWEVKRLGDLAEMGSGGTPLSSVPAFYDGGIPWVSIADMTRAGRVLETTEKTLTPRGLESSAAQLFPAGTVLYAMYASLGECCITDLPVTTSQAILGIRPKYPLISELLYYILSALKGKVRTLGQQGTQANLNKGIVQDFQIALPSREEQIAIAAVLSDMDAELTALEARRDKTRALKQAMMQELLTGRIRLV